MAFVGRESFRIERVAGANPDGAIPKAVSDTPTGRIFDRRRITRTVVAAPQPLTRSPQSLVVLLVTTFAAGVLAAIAIVTLGNRTPAAPRTAHVAPNVPTSTAITSPAPVVSPPAPVAQSAPILPAPAIVAPAAPLDEPTPTGPQPAVPPRRLRSERATRPAARVSPNRIAPPTRAWVDPFAG